MQTEYEAVVESIAHWERMVCWAKGQPQRRRTNAHRMFADILESWGSLSCSLCWFNKNKCGYCILCIVGRLPCRADGAAWRAVDQSKTWGKWTENAEKRMIPMLLRAKAQLMEDTQ